jgi:hypothetical protein
MTKKFGFIIRLDAFLEIDKKNFSKQAEAFALMADIEKSGKLPAEFFERAKVLGLTVKQGNSDIPDTPTSGNQGDEFDPANWPLTTDALPEGAAVLESTTDLAGHIFQTIRLVDGAETFRRITAEQDAAETGKTIPPQVDDGKAAEIRAAEAAKGKK